MSDPRTLRALVAAALLGPLAACGQKGPLYLPEQAREVVTRPAQTPPAAPDAQAPEATSPEEDKEKPDTTAPR
jgi:predicted small lipoprotein YifL